MQHKCDRFIKKMALNLYLSVSTVLQCELLYSVINKEILYPHSQIVEGLCALLNNNKNHSKLLCTNSEPSLQGALSVTTLSLRLL